MKEQIELNLTQLLNISKLYVTECANQFAINAGEIDFPLAPQLVEVEQKLGLDTEAGEIIAAALLDPKSQWDYQDAEGVKLVHYCKKFYVPKTLRKRTVPSLPMSPRWGQARCHFNSSVHMERYSIPGTDTLQTLQCMSKIQKKKYQIWTSTFQGSRILRPMEYRMCRPNWTLFVEGQDQSD